MKATVAENRSLGTQNGPVRKTARYARDDSRGMWSGDCRKNPRSVTIPCDSESRASLVRLRRRSRLARCTRAA
jgi:hypothetical protein